MPRIQKRAFVESWFKLQEENIRVAIADFARILYHSRKYVFSQMLWKKAVFLRTFNALSYAVRKGEIFLRKFYVGILKSGAIRNSTITSYAIKGKCDEA